MKQSFSATNNKDGKHTIELIFKGTPGTAPIDFYFQSGEILSLLRILALVLSKCHIASTVAVPTQGNQFLVCTEI